ncbi:hypothetical protein PtB15_12B410 [Puccinia triticina]|nr:hypothetical protein PtB15_12B410 [Puccinia triticina]
MWERKNQARTTPPARRRKTLLSRTLLATPTAIARQPSPADRAIVASTAASRATLGQHISPEKKHWAHSHDSHPQPTRQASSAVPGQLLPTYSTKTTCNH